MAVYHSIVSPDGGSSEWATLLTSPARHFHFCFANGSQISFINSIFDAWGSTIVAPRAGVLFHNRGQSFRLEAEHPNAIAGGKRPFHTIIPGFLTKDGRPVGPFGVMGGHMQPQGHLQVVMSTVDDGLDPQAALDAPRWYWHAGRQVYVEPDLDGIADLRRRGHEVTVDESDLYGYGQAVWYRPDRGYVAGSEPRADGAAVGY